MSSGDRANAGTDTSPHPDAGVSARRSLRGQRPQSLEYDAQRATHMLLLARHVAAGSGQAVRGMTLFFTPFTAPRSPWRRSRSSAPRRVTRTRSSSTGWKFRPTDVVGEVGRGFYHLLDSLNPSGHLTGVERSASAAPRSRRGAVRQDRVVFDARSARTRRSRIPLAMAWPSSRARGMCLKAAWLFDSGRPCGARQHRKLLAADAGFEACDAALQTHGGYGYARSSTSSGSGARSALTRSRRSRSRWS